VCVIFSREEVALVAGIAKQKTPGKKNNFWVSSLTVDFLSWWIWKNTTLPN
jgi:hypothetical protein